LLPSTMILFVSRRSGENWQNFMAYLWNTDFFISSGDSPPNYRLNIIAKFSVNYSSSFA